MENLWAPKWKNSTRYNNILIRIGRLLLNSNFIKTNLIKNSSIINLLIEIECNENEQVKNQN